MAGLKDRAIRAGRKLHATNALIRAVFLRRPLIMPRSQFLQGSAEAR